MRCLIVLSLLVFLAAAGQAADQAEPAKINLELADLDVGQALSNLSQMCQITVLADPGLKGRVTCNLSSVTVEQALDIICKTNKLVWVKVYVRPKADGQLSASTLFKLLDSVKELGGSALICEDTKAQSQTIFIPSAQTGSVDASAIAKELKLTTVYLVRTESDPAASAKDETEKTDATGPAGVAPLLQIPPSDPREAAGRAWDYFRQMPIEQSVRAVHELQHMLYRNMSPEQREELRRAFGGERRGWMGERPPGPGIGMPGPGPGPGMPGPPPHGVVPPPAPVR